MSVTFAGSPPTASASLAWRRKAKPYCDIDTFTGVENCCRMELAESEVVGQRGAGLGDQGLELLRAIGHADQAREDGIEGGLLLGAELARVVHPTAFQHHGGEAVEVVADAVDMGERVGAAVVSGHAVP